MISVTEIESDMFLEKVDVSGHMSHRCHFFEAFDGVINLQIDGFH